MEDNKSLHMSLKSELNKLTGQRLWLPNSQGQAKCFNLGEPTCFVCFLVLEFGSFSMRGKISI